MKNKGKIFMAILAAALYGISAPASKILLQHINPLFMASLLYLGAGLGMYIYYSINKLRTKEPREAALTKSQLPYIVVMIVLDIAAPILLLLGLRGTSAGAASLLNNFEIVATSVIALIIFKEAIGKRQWIALVLIIAASSILSVDVGERLTISFSAVFILLACICWGIENNATRQLSLKDPVQIVIIKGFGSGLGALLVCAMWGDFSTNLFYIICALVLGFVSYGLSILFYVFAQRSLGAVRTSIYYSIAPFIGVILSWILLRESITYSFLVALMIMICATYLMMKEEHSHTHVHEGITHEHKHSHGGMHHSHVHDEPVSGSHTHEHTHGRVEHSHSHYPDEHHRHSHDE